MFKNRPMTTTTRIAKDFYPGGKLPAILLHHACLWLIRRCVSKQSGVLSFRLIHPQMSNFSLDFLAKFALIKKCL